MGIANKMKGFFHNEGIHSTTIQPEFVTEDKTGNECALECGQDKTCAEQKCCPAETGTELKKHSKLRANEGIINPGFHAV